MEEKIQLLHPEGKKGMNISKRKYEQVKEIMLSIFSEKREISHSELMREMENKLTGKFEGNIMWYSESVKLDLEARSVIERVKGSKPQIIRLK